MIDHLVNDWITCRRGMLMRLWILGITTAVVASDLTGDHICEFEESYPVNVTEFTWRNVTVRNYKWCMGFPPRCSFYTFKSVKVPLIIEINEKKTVKKCCPGYAEDKDGKNCVPCMKCYEGSCGNEGKCICNPGFRGDDCSSACEAMRWGSNCLSDCLCERGTCDPRTGRCECPSGWFGTRCELLCLEGFFGKHCINRCNCGERDLCDPETGECLQKRTRQEHQSTRAIHYMTGDFLNISSIIDKEQSSPSLKKYHTFDMELNYTKPMFTTTTEKYEEKKKTPSTVLTPIIQQNKTISREEKEESVESTTELSAEIPYDENVPIINENGSFEKKESTENINGGKTTNLFTRQEKYTTEASSVRSEKNHNPMEGMPFGSKDASEPPRNWGNISLNNRNEVSSENASISKTPLHTNNDIDVKSSTTAMSTKPPKKTLATQNNTITRQPKLLTNYPHFTDSSTFATSDYTQIDRRFTKAAIETKEETNIPPIPRNTQSIDRTDHKSNPQIIEEDYLQNLDDLNVLTSRESSTSYVPLTTTLKSIPFMKEGILPITEIKTSTRSFGDNIGNDISTIDSMEDQKPQKEAFDLPRGKEGNYLRDQASGEFEYSMNEKNNLPTHMAIAGILSFILVLIMSAIMLLHNYAKKRRKKDSKPKTEHHQNYPGGPRVSVYAHSIFHTPLPDPPTFENPIFATPTENSMDRTFQTHVVCSLNFSGHQRPEDKEYTYDHPPSTGSYRAASIPEPPDINEGVTTEPLYDEIPSNGKLNNSSSPPPSYKSSCIYMNTCGKTKF